MMDAADIDTVAEHDGFARQLIAVNLATDRDGKVFLRGVTERIQWLHRLAENGRKGGLTKAANASSSQAVAKQLLSHPLATPYPLTLDLTHALDQRSAAPMSGGQDLDPLHPEHSGASVQSKIARAKRPKGDDYTEAELADTRLVLDKLGDRTQVQYRGSKEHTALIVRHLRSGLTSWDLRRVIGYCAYEMGWATKPNMRPYLRPETLFGPETIERYIDAARAWEPALEPPEIRPQLRLVADPPPPDPVTESTYDDDNLEHDDQWMTNS